MYDFIDIMEVQDSPSLPAEAMSINGVYLENEVEGYRTLYVTGRELPEAEIEEQQIGKADGTEYQSKRFVPRVITVTYQLVGNTPEEFRERFNRLNRILNQEEAKIVFRDEPDKYFIGTKSAGDEIPGGALNVTGSFQFYCTNPYKYAATEKTFQASAGSNGVLEATIVNDGAGAVSINYGITHNHDNGYIGIVSDLGVLQFGDADEVDKEIRQKSQRLIDYKTAADFSAMTDGQGVMAENFPKNGTFKTTTINGKQWLGLDNVGTGNKWHGACKKVTIPADSGGASGAVNFTARAQVWFQTARVKETGLLQLTIGDTDGKHLASIHIFKSNIVANEAVYVMHINTKERKRVSYTPNSKSSSSADKGSIYIKKMGAKFEYYCNCIKHSFQMPEMKDKKALTLTVFLGQFGTCGAENLVNRMYFNSVSFQKDNVNYWYNIPNRYAQGSFAYVDGNKTKFYVDGVESLGDEIVGSKYFLAPPGEMKVQFYCSEFCSPKPTIYAKIREAFL